MLPQSASADLGQSRRSARRSQNANSKTATAIEWIDNRDRFMAAAVAALAGKGDDILTGKP
jgi:hypothetical protein